MMKEILPDKSNKKTIHRQIADHIILKIESGELHLGDQISSINEFSVTCSYQSINIHDKGKSRRLFALYIYSIRAQ